jgi:subtilase family serine protease
MIVSSMEWDLSKAVRPLNKAATICARIVRLLPAEENGFAVVVVVVVVVAVVEIISLQE